MELDINADPKTEQVGSFYVRISQAPVARTIPYKDEDDPEILVDVDSAGKVVGIEFLGARA